MNPQQPLTASEFDLLKLFAENPNLPLQRDWLLETMAHREAEPLDGGVEQDLLQDAAMDRELRPFVAGFQPARLAPDRLAVLGEVGKFPRTHAGRVEGDREQRQSAMAILDRSGARQ